MRFGDYLNKEQKQQLNNSVKAKHEKVNWKEIMGMNQQTLHKKNGAWRRK